MLLQDLTMFATVAVPKALAFGPWNGGAGEDVPVEATPEELAAYSGRGTPLEEGHGFLQTLSQDIQVQYARAMHFAENVIYTPEQAGGAAGLAAAAITSVITHYAQEKRAQVIPVMLSRLDLVDKASDEVRFLAAVNDMAMTITRAWNASKESTRFPKPFAKHLDRDELRMQIGMVTALGREFYAKLESYRVLSEFLKNAAVALDNSWTYTSHDNYRTETYTAKENGKTVTKSRRVYEDTDHYFTYYRKHAEQAAAILQDLYGQFPGMTFFDPNVTGYRVAAERLKGDEMKSVKRDIIHTVLENPKAIVNDAEVDKLMNMWITGTVVDDNLRTALAWTKSIGNSYRGDMETVFNSRKNYHYNTTSRSHSGPPGFRAARHLQGQLSNTAEKIDEILNAICACLERAANVEKLLLEGMTPDGEKKSLEKKFLDEAVEAYEAMFPKSEIPIDQRNSAGTTALIALGVGLAVGLGTFFLHPYAGYVNY